MKFQDTDATPPAAPLLLPPPNPAHHREPRYDEQDIDGYTIAEAHGLLPTSQRESRFLMVYSHPY